VRKFSVAAAMLASLGFASSAVAESFEDICHRVSEEWGTQGDVGAQCACLAGKAAADGAVDSELRSLADSYSSDAEAYEAASAGTKAALDACSVNS
jgi:hypothetical protein